MMLPTNRSLSLLRLFLHPRHHWLLVLAFFLATVCGGPAASAAAAVADHLAEPPATRSIRVARMGTVREYSTAEKTVDKALQKLNINLAGRQVYPDLGSKVENGMIIHVLGSKSYMSTEEVPVPFPKQVIDDPSLPYGEEKVEQTGRPGLDRVTYENVTRTGFQQKIELDRVQVTKPVQEIIRRGVKQAVWTPEGYQPYRYKLTVESSAYTWGAGASGLTSLGLTPRKGIVAVDPRVIPYYTKLYIPGYGMAMAGDTGGAIRGHRIDLFMNSVWECYQWGRRDVEIYVL